MKVSLLSLITTPFPVLNSLGMGSRVGLSSDDPTALRHTDEEYQAYLSVYSSEGVLDQRIYLGAIPPNRRKLFDISSLTHQFVPGGDHLCVVHRVPSNLLAQVTDVEEPLELEHLPDYYMYRSLIEYSYPRGGNGSVVYETPPALNVSRTGRPTSETLTFSSKIVLSELVNTYVVLIHYSQDPSYTTICPYNFSVLDMSGSTVASDRVGLGPFSVRVLDIGAIVPVEEVRRSTDSEDGLATFTFLGFSDQASVLSLVINASQQLGAISVEHTHPAQEYLLPRDLTDRRKTKSDAIKRWKAMLGRC
jgi:hypothetical protein